MYDTIRLPNGLTIVTEIIPFVRSVSFGIWVKNGSRNENAHTSGISHFIEHMLFKGTENRSAKDIADEMDQVGGQINAYTSKEYTCYYTRTLDSHFDIALDILADMFFNSKFAEDDIQKERNVILEEISMYEDAPEDLVHDILQYNIWNGDPLGLSILGTEVSISSFERPVFMKYYNEHYHPENTVIAIAGNFDQSDVVKKVESYFGGFTRESECIAGQFSTSFSPCIVTREKDIEQVHICFGFPSISVGSDLSYSLAALNTIFGGGMSSRLFQRVREEYGYAYSIYSYNSSYTDTGLISIYAGINPVQARNAIGLIISEIRRLSTERIEQVQLEKAKEQIKSNYVLSLESSSNRMNSIGRSQLMLNRLVSPDELLEKIEAVNLATVYGLVEQIFNLDNLALSAVGNIGGIDFAEIVNSAVAEIGIR